MPDVPATLPVLSTDDPAGSLHPPGSLQPDGAVQPAGAAAITRGVRRALAQRGFVSVTEFRLNGGRRADVLALDADGTVMIVEVKSSVADFRSDRKWPVWCVLD